MIYKAAVLGKRRYEKGKRTSYDYSSRGLLQILFEAADVAKFSLAWYEK